MDDMIVSYFNVVFSSGGSRFNEVIQCMDLVISSKQNQMLTAPFSPSDVRNALSGMHPDKSPRPDGTNLAFYQKFWHIIGHDVLATCLEFINRCEFPQGFNNTLIFLILKK